MSEGYQALRHGAAWLDVSNRSRFLVRGRDRARLLHNLTTNEVKKLAPGTGCYAFLLSPQGRIQADPSLFCFDDRFLIDTEPELREKAPAHLRRYIVADQVELLDVTADTAALALEGPGVAAVLAAIGAPVPAAAYEHLPWEDSTVAAVSLTGQPGFRIYCAPSKMADLVRQVEAAGARPASAEDARVLRIENGKPRYGEDIRETSLPQETAQMQAVSFTKGCYLGQEIVERIRAQGHVNKLLSRLEIEGTGPLPAGTKLTAEGAEAGEVTSSVYSPHFGKAIALAYLRTPFAQTGRLLEAGSATARVR